MSVWLLSLFTATGVAVMASSVAEEPLCQVEHEGSDGCTALGQGAEPAHISLLQTSLATGRAGILEESTKMEKTVEVPYSGKRDYDDLPMCDFAKGEPPFPSWDKLYNGKYKEEAEKFYKVIQDMNDVGAVVVLLYGTLLGAYRHHGVLPFDEDLDVHFDVCNNDDIIRSSGSSFAGMDCAAIKKVEKELGGYYFHKKVWEEVLKPSFTKIKPEGLFRTKHLDTDEWYPVTHDSLPYGVRVSRDGTWGGPKPFQPGMDMTIVTGNWSENQQAEHIDPFTYNFSKSQLCRCNFGPVKAHCSVHSKEILIENYGEDFMVPKSQCDYYTDGSWHPELKLNFRTQDECEWAKNLTSAPKAPELPQSGAAVKSMMLLAALALLYLA